MDATGCAILIRIAISPTVHSLPPRISQIICRRRGSAIALKTSVVVEVLAIEITNLLNCCGKAVGATTHLSAAASESVSLDVRAKARVGPDGSWRDLSG